jgi:plastocyanin
VSAATITIKNFAFQPATMTAKAGSTITVKNNDTTTHTVTADNSSFNTGNIDSGVTKTFTVPSTPGSVPYHCSIHPFMHGTLTVTS